VNFAFSEEQEELRTVVRQFLDNKSSESAVREQMETERGFDDDVWKQMGEQMGLQGLIIPEDFGGSGFSYVELIVVLEEMGRSLLCAPYFSTVVLAANTLIHSGDDAAKSELLPGIASGETIATLAFTEENGRWDEEGVTTTATADGDGFKLNGTKMFVLDGHTADLILVAARTDKGVSSPARRCRPWTRRASRPSSSSPTPRPSSSAPTAAAGTCCPPSSISLR
jgi:alkylation response protein AidB-like acyl-CoA dehydrogenase